MNPVKKNKHLLNIVEQKKASSRFPPDMTEARPIDGDLKGYFSGRSTRTFQTPPSYAAEGDRERSAHRNHFNPTVERTHGEILTSSRSVELDHELVEPAEDGDLVLALNADSWVKEDGGHKEVRTTA